MYRLKEHLSELGLSQTELAQLLDVNDRTVRRWIQSPVETPVAAQHAINAWVRLHRRSLAWRPDYETLGEDEAEIADQVARVRDHNIALDRCLNFVESQGGPKAEFEVDLKRRSARNDRLQVGFYALSNGSFSPANYRRLGSTTREEAHELLPDAYYCIAQAIKRAGHKWHLN
ncbi:MAG: helix-turn-helix transcriptional regulator [Proteobacteria bacterium]|nr:helix-turn-helix transcriptional regulator [Pseudomonadota bacterium]